MHCWEFAEYRILENDEPFTVRASGFSFEAGRCKTGKECAIELSAFGTYRCALSSWNDKIDGSVYETRMGGALPS